MPKAKRDTSLYRRGKYWLDWDQKRDGTLRSPFLAVFHYDPATRRVRSTSTGTTDGEAGRKWLDAFYLKNETGQVICPTCGQARNASTSYLVTEAIEAYLSDVGDERASAGAIRSRLNHVLDYIATLPDPGVQATAVNEQWIGRFRKWAIKQPIVSPKGHKRPRSLSTVETSVAQLSAAINHAHKSKQILSGSDFKTVPFKEVNRTPQHRSDVEELAAMFCYAMGYPALRRFLTLSVATLGRPDAVHDFHIERQWKGRAIELNPRDRRQTKKYRATVPTVRQIIPALNEASGWFVGVKSVRRAWEAMSDFIGLPTAGEGGMKLVRRSMADLLRRRLPQEAWGEIEIFMGHDKFEETSGLYAPLRPDYLRRAKAEIEAIIDEIEEFVPNAFTGLAPETVVATDSAKG
ncbi:hypothetical protein SH584_11295 [Sphingomonas sp. LY29]|uniref:hypothetical protein n=1 Tax=Sphingomonas sp. LY29 TaxID=3095341 RepID=UPI002D7995CA|nr:hypothetical protein [Sphingomonas sp. LY29]WRP25616.1 hypothetical protein SH584_11295 [Sphingomonas sp. LY29]